MAISYKHFIAVSLMTLMCGCSHEVHSTTPRTIAGTVSSNAVIVIMHTIFGHEVHSTTPRTIAESKSANTKKN